MTSKERVLTALNHQKPDRVPVDFQATNEIWKKMMNHFNVSDSEDVLNALQIDCRWIWPDFKGTTKVFDDGSYEGFGGSIFKNINNGFGSYNEVIKYSADSAQTPEDLDRMIRLPDLDEYEYGCIFDKCKELKDFFILTGSASTFYYPTLVRSMENILVDMAADEEMAKHLFDKCANWHISHCERILEAGKGQIDALQIADDFSTQLDLLMSLDMFKKYFSENIDKFVKLGKSYGAKIYLHCCGSVYKIIPELIRLGVEVLDPIQTTAKNMNPAALKSEFGNAITFHGAADTQTILPAGAPDEVKKHAKALVQILGENGGYILSSCHALQPDVPVESILALYELENRL